MVHRATSTGCDRRRGEARESPRWLETRGAARAVRTTGSTTGASRASATGARRSRSSTAMLRRRAGAREQTCRCCCRHRGFPSRRFGRLAAGAPRGVVSRAVPAVRQAGAPRDRRLGHVSRQRVVFPALSERRPRRRAVRRGADATWLPVNSYIGGNEHAVLHLLYSRFITMVLHDAGLLAFEEPFTRFRAHGLIIRDGAKMSKSQGQRRQPRRVHRRVGRGHVAHVPDVPGTFRAGRRLPRQRASAGRGASSTGCGISVRRRHGPQASPTATVMRKLHQTDPQGHGGHPQLCVQHGDRGDDGVHERRCARGERSASRREVEPLVQLVAPFAPHFAEELWERWDTKGACSTRRGRPTTRRWP